MAITIDLKLERDYITHCLLCDKLVLYDLLDTKIGRLDLKKKILYNDDDLDYPEYYYVKCDENHILPVLSKQDAYLGAQTGYRTVALFCRDCGKCKDCECMK